MSEWQVHLKDSYSHAMSAPFCSLSLLILNVIWHSQDNHFLTWNTCLTHWTSNPPLSLVWTSFTSALLAKWHHLYKLPISFWYFIFYFQDLDAVDVTFNPYYNCNVFSLRGFWSWRLMFFLWGFYIDVT